MTPFLVVLGDNLYYYTSLWRSKRPWMRGCLLREISVDVDDGDGGVAGEEGDGAIDAGGD